MRKVPHLIKKDKKSGQCNPEKILRIAMNRLLTFCIIMLATCQGHALAQEDSLRKVLAHTHSIPERVSAYSGISQLLLNQGRTGQALAFQDSALLYFQGENANAQRVKLLNHFVKQTYMAGHYGRTELLLARLKPLVAGDTLALAKLENRLAVIFQRQSLYESALRHFRKSLAHYDSLGNRTGQANLLINLGILYKKLEDYPNARKYLSQALAFYTETQDSLGISRGLSMLGTVEKQTSNYRAAAGYYAH